MSLLNVGTENIEVKEVSIVDTVLGLNLGLEREYIEEVVDECGDEEVVYTLADDREEIDNAQSEINKLTEVADKLEVAIENDKVDISMGNTDNMEASLEVLEEAVFDSDVEPDTDITIGLENASTLLEKLAVGLEAKETLLRKINRKVREFIKMIIRNIKKMFVKIFVFISGFFVDIAKHRDSIEELEEEVIKLTGSDLDSKLSKRIKKILGYYLTDMANELQLGDSKRGNDIVLKAAYNCLDAISGFYNDRRIDDVKELYDNLIVHADEDTYRMNTSYVINYLSKANKETLPATSKVRKVLENTDKLIYAVSSTTPVGLKVYTLSKGKKENKKKWEVDYGTAKHKYSGSLADINVSELKEFANEATATMDSFDLNSVIKATFSILAEMDDDLARYESNGKGSKTKLRKIQQMVKFISSSSIEYIYSTHSNVKALNALLKTLAQES